MALYGTVMITHVVVFWTDKPQDEHRAKLLEGAERLLATIPGVSNFRYGPALASSRAAVDDSFAMAISMDYTSHEAGATYQSHPQHIEFVEQYVKPLAKRFVVYAFGAPE